MIEVIHPIQKLELRYFGEKKGYGVFKLNDIQKDEKIEICYCIDMEACPPRMWRKWKYFNREFKKPVLALGYGSVYNHSYTPNVHYYFESDCILVMYALRDIKEGEELCHNYGENYFKVFPTNII